MTVVAPALDIAGCIRVARAQARLAAGVLGFGDLVQLHIDEIPITTTRRGRPGRAGRAGFFQGHHGHGLGRIVINVGVCYNDERFLHILYHELAHAVNFWVNGPGCDSHGPQWKAVMERLGQEPVRCHSYADRK